MAGKWVKGESGNPLGRPKLSVNLRELCRTHTEKAIQSLASIMVDEDQPAAARITAANTLLDRGYGKAVAHVELKTNDTPQLALDEVARMMAFAIRDKQERDTIIEQDIVISIDPPMIECD